MKLKNNECKKVKNSFDGSTSMHQLNDVKEEEDHEGIKSPLNDVKEEEDHEGVESSKLENIGQFGMEHIEIKEEELELLEYVKSEERFYYEEASGMLSEKRINLLNEVTANNRHLELRENTGKKRKNNNSQNDDFKKKLLQKDEKTSERTLLHRQSSVRQEMNASSFYGGQSDSSSGDSEDSDHSDFSVNSDDTDDDLSEEPDESEADEEQDEADGDASNSGNNIKNNPRAVQPAAWLPVLSKQRMHAFTGKEEMTVTVNNADIKVQPIDVYALFVSDYIIDMIVKETNRYAEQEIDTERLVSWRPTNREEIKKFLGILMYMGLVVKPEIPLYWAKSVLYDDPFVRKLMGRDRFEFLLRFVHFVDNSAHPNSQDILYKIKPLIDLLVENFQAVYKPGSKLVINEYIVPFRERLGIRQYIPGKAHKHGLKLYKVCTPEGYTWNLEVHVGMGYTIPGLNSAESRVVNLCKEMLGNGCTIYSDNYYNSITLAEYLLVKKTYICGTVRSFRKNMCKEVLKAKLKKGEMKAAENRQGVKLYKWKDKRDVLTISTVPEHGNNLIPSGKKNRKGEAVIKPESVIEYNKTRKGVDVADQIGTYYSPVQKSRKWYRKLGLEMIVGISVTNAQVLYNKYCSAKRVSVRTFTESLILSLTKNIPEENVKSGRRASDISGTRKKHTLMETAGKKNKTRKRCRGCYQKISLCKGYKVAARRAKRVSTYCNECDGQPHLCITCFNEKHD